MIDHNAMSDTIIMTRIEQLETELAEALEQIAELQKRLDECEMKYENRNTTDL